MSGHRTLGSLQLRFLGAGLSAVGCRVLICDIWEGLPVIRSWVESKEQFLFEMLTTIPSGVQEGEKQGTVTIEVQIRYRNTV